MLHPIVELNQDVLNSLTQCVILLYQQHIWNQQSSPVLALEASHQTKTKFKGTCCHLLVTCSTACPLLHHSWQCPCWAAFDFSMLWLYQNYSLGIVMQLKHHSSLTHTCWCVFPLLSSVCESWHALGQLGLLRTCRPPSPSPLGKPNQTHPRLVEAHPLVLHLFKALYRSESLPQYNISLHRRMMVKNEWQHCIWHINGFLALSIQWVLSY